MDHPTVASIRKKADNFRNSSFNAKTKALAKRAILRELNDTLSVSRSKLCNEEISTHLDIPREGSLHRTFKGKERPSRTNESRYKGSESKVQGIDGVQVANLQRPSNYQWNQKGRLNELKIRFLARKYTAIWKVKVYGRISPEWARKHYNINLMKKAMNTWQDLWWSGRKGWKLHIRANYHNRFRLWQKTFNSWRLYVELCRKKHGKSLKADNFYAKRLTATVWKGWCLFTLHMEYKRHLQGTAISHRQATLTRMAFTVWTRKHSFKSSEKERELQALEFSDIRITKTSWKKWQHQLSASHFERRQLGRACEHHSICQKRKAFDSLLAYVESQREKMTRQDLSSSFRDYNIKARYFKVWFDQLHIRLRHKELAAKILFLEEQNRKRRSFRAWTWFLARKRCKLVAWNAACQHHERQLKVLILRVLKAQVRKQKQKNYLCQMADRFRDGMVQKRAWKVWLVHVEDLEELGLLSKTHIARLKYRRSLHAKVIQVLKKNVAYRRERKCHQDIADGFYRKIVLPRFFGALLSNVALEQERKQREYDAESFNREVLLTKYWFTWFQRLEERQFTSMLSGQAVDFEQRNLKQKAMSKWKRKMTEQMRDKGKQFLAEDFFNKYSLRKAFEILHKEAKEGRRRRKSENIALGHLRRLMLKKSFDAWNSYRIGKCKRKRANDMASGFFSSKILHLALVAWKNEVFTQRRIKEEAEKKHVQKCSILLRGSLLQWRANIVLQQEARRKNSMAHRHCSVTVVRKTFEQWRLYSLIHSERKKQQLETLQGAFVTLSEGLLRRTFLKWRLQAEFHRKQRSWDHKATSHFHQRLRNGTLIAWKAYTALQYRKKILAKKSQDFQKRIAYKKYFAEWTKQIKSKNQEKKKSNFAIWWWSYSLQRKVLLSWMQYTENRREGKQAVSMALHFRKDYFVREAIRHWLTFASHEMERRRAAASHRNNELASALNERVRRIALHWCRKSNERTKTSFTDQVETALVLTDPARYQHICPQMERSVSVLSMPLPKSNRQAPRLPEYLRASFDLNSLVTQNADYNDPDQPYPRLGNPIPHNPADISKVLDTSYLALSSDGEDIRATSVDKGKIRLLRNKTARLVPPSYFAGTNHRKKAHIGHLDFGPPLRKVVSPGTSTLQSSHDSQGQNKITSRDEVVPTKEEQASRYRCEAYKAVKSFNHELRDLTLQLAKHRELEKRVKFLLDKETESAIDDTKTAEPSQFSTELEEARREFFQVDREVKDKKRQLGNRSLAIQDLISRIYP